MSAVFEFVESSTSTTPMRLSRSVRQELNVLLDLFPVMFADLRTQSSSRMYASDASKHGAGVTYADLSPQKLRNFLKTAEQTRVRKGWHTFLTKHAIMNELNGHEFCMRVTRGFVSALEGMKFHTAISTRWRFMQNINLLEVEAAILAVRHMQRANTTQGHRVVLLVDSTGALGALVKGRSSSSALNRSCRRFLAATLRSNVNVQFFWVPSELNPADEPSRAIHSPRIAGKASTPASI